MCSVRAQLSGLAYVLPAPCLSKRACAVLVAAGGRARLGCGLRPSQAADGAARPGALLPSSLGQLAKSRAGVAVLLGMQGRLGVWADSSSFAFILLSEVHICFSASTVQL